MNVNFVKWVRLTKFGNPLSKSEEYTMLPSKQIRNVLPPVLCCAEGFCEVDFGLEQCDTGDRVRCSAGSSGMVKTC